MIVTRIASLDDFVSLADEWDELLKKSDQGNVFLSYEWMHNWWQAYGTGGELFLLICRSVEDDVLVGILPLYRKQEGWLPRVKLLKFIAGSNVGSDFLEPIYLPGKHQQIFESFFGYLENNKHEWDVIEFSSVEVNSSFYFFLNDKKNKFSTFIPDSSQICPYVTLPESWEEMLSSLSKKVRQKVGYYRRSLTRNGSYEIARVTDEKELKDSLDYLMRIRKNRLEAKGIDFEKVSCLYKKFHEKIMANFLRKGWLDLYFLKLQNKPVAFVYQFVFQGRIFFYQTGFDRTYSSQSVGFVLLGHVIEGAIKEKKILFEFLRGDEKYKYDWNISKLRKIADVFFFMPDFRSMLYVNKKKIRNIVVKKIRTALSALLAIKNIFMRNCMDKYHVHRDIVTNVNVWAKKNIKFQKLLKIIYEILWVDKVEILEFDIACIHYMQDDLLLSCGELNFRLATEDDIKRMAEAGVYNFSISGIPYYTFISQNENFMVLIENRFQIVGYAACIFRSKKMGNLFFHMMPNEGFVLACFTCIEHRGKGYGPLCIKKILQYCLNNKIQKLYIDISTSNQSSTKSALKAGAEYCCSGFYRLRFFKKDYVFPYGKLKSKFVSRV